MSDVGRCFTVSHESEPCGDCVGCLADSLEGELADARAYAEAAREEIERLNRSVVEMSKERDAAHLNLGIERDEARQEIERLLGENQRMSAQIDEERRRHAREREEAGAEVEQLRAEQCVWQQQRDEARRALAEAEQERDTMRSYAQEVGAVMLEEPGQFNDMDTMAAATVLINKLLEEGDSFAVSSVRSFVGDPDTDEAEPFLCDLLIQKAGEQTFQENLDACKADNEHLRAQRSEANEAVRQLLHTAAQLQESLAEAHLNREGLELATYDAIRNWMLKPDSPRRVNRWFDEGGMQAVAVNLCRALYEEIYALWNPSPDDCGSDAAMRESAGEESDAEAQ